MAEHMAELPVNTVNESNASGKVEQRRYIVTSSTMSEAQVALYVYNPVKRLSWCSGCKTLQSMKSLSGIVYSISSTFVFMSCFI